MPLLTKSAPQPPKPPKPKNKPASAASVKKPASQRRRPLEENTEVYGDALFESATKPIKIVYLNFHNLLTNNIRISVCRKYAIEYIPNHHKNTLIESLEDTNLPLEVSVDAYSVFYFPNTPNPLLPYADGKDIEFVFDKSLAKDSLLEVFDLKEICDKLVEWEKAYQIELIKNSTEGADDEPITINEGEHSTDSVTENVGEESSSTETEIVREEVQQETNDQEVQNEKIGEGTEG